MKRTLIGSLILGLFAVVLSAQEPAIFERGLTVIRGRLTLAQISGILMEVGDGGILSLGNDNDQAFVNRASTLAANTALTNVLIGTPVTRAVAANSLLISNVTASGDVGLYANRGGNSEEYLLVDSSAGQLRLTSPAAHLLLNTVASGTAVRINVRTDTAQSSGDLIALRVAPRIGVTGTQNVFGAQIQGSIADNIALTGSGSVIGLQADTYFPGTTAATIAGDVRTLQIETVTDDAGTRTISGYVTGIRIRTAFSATAITGNFTAMRIEAPEAQTNSQNYDAILDFRGTHATVWHDDPTTEPSTAAGYLKVIVNGNDRYIQLYSTAPTN